MPDRESALLARDSVGVQGHRSANRTLGSPEFFFASPEAVRDVLAAKVGNLLEFNEHADATEYLQSLSGWPTDVAAPGPSTA